MVTRVTMGAAARPGTASGRKYLIIKDLLRRTRE